MRPNSPDMRQSRLLTLGAVALCVAALYFARDILMPFALAVLISFLLAPLARRLQRIGLGRTPSVLLSVGFALAVVGGIGWLVAGQITELASQAETYKDNLREKLLALEGQVPQGLREATSAIEDISEDAVRESEDADGKVEPVSPEEVARALTAPNSVSRDPDRAIPVRIVDSRSLLRFAGDWLGPLLGPLGMMGIVTVLVLFMLFNREDLRARLILLIGRGALPTTTDALDEAASRVSRYLRMQLIINLMYGAAVAAGLYLLGLPSALFWGLLGAAFRFIPYVGPWVTALGAVALSLAVFDGWTLPLATAAMFLVFELVVNNVLEPLLYGASTGVSPVGIIASAAFWTWLWGGPGLFLATPLTVCLVVLGRYVPRLQFLSILLSDDPAVSPSSHLYQRLLAMDDDDAADIVERAAAEQDDAAALFDELLLPALAQAESDFERGLLDDRRREFVHDSLLQLGVDVLERADESPRDKSCGEDSASGDATIDVLCVPAHDEGDEVASHWLGECLRRRGKRVVDVPLISLASEVVQLVDAHAPSLLMIVATPTTRTRHAEYLCRRLQARERRPRILVCQLSDDAEGSDKDTARLRRAGADLVVASFTAALERFPWEASEGKSRQPTPAQPAGA